MSTDILIVRLVAGELAFFKEEIIVHRGLLHLISGGATTATKGFPLG